MKSCPTCLTDYDDERLSYCRLDGAMLTRIDADQDTVCLETGRKARLKSPSKLRTKSVQPVPIKTATRRERPSSRAIDSLAVLPFSNDSRAESMDYFSDGITESVINTLSRLPELRVIARNTMFRYKRPDADPAEVSRDLGVRAVLTGRVRQIEDRVIIGTELIDAKNNAQLWGQHYSRPLSDIFEIQEDIAQEICDCLRPKLTAGLRRRMSTRPTKDSDAYKNYLKGRYHLNKWTEAGFRKSIHYFERALEKDSGYAAAYSGLGDGYGGLWYFNYAPPREAVPLARRYATRALEIDDSLAEAHLSLASIKFFFEWDWEQAEREFERAIELNPNLAAAYQMYAIYLVAMGRFEDASLRVSQARDLDPLSVTINWTAGFVTYYAREYEDARKLYLEALELDETFPWIHEGLGSTYIMSGDYEEAADAFTKMIPYWAVNGGIAAELKRACREDGVRGFWRQWIEFYDRDLMHSYATAYFAAGAYGFLGETDKAIDCLEQACDERLSFVVFARVDPWFDSLRSHPRFHDLLTRIFPGPRVM